MPPPSFFQAGVLPQATAHDKQWLLPESSSAPDKEVSVPLASGHKNIPVCTTDAQRFALTGLRVDDINVHAIEELKQSQEHEAILCQNTKIIWFESLFHQSIKRKLGARSAAVDWISQRFEFGGNASKSKPPW